MSLGATVWAWKHKVSPAAKILLLMLADEWNGLEGEGHLAFDKADLALDIMVSRSELDLAISELCQAGAFHWIDREDDELLVSLAYLETAFALPQNARVPIPASMRERVLVEGGRRCAECGSEHDLQIDHMLPVCRGGTNDRSNLQVLCAPCNLSKRDKTMEEWRGAR